MPTGRGASQAARAALIPATRTLTIRSLAATERWQPHARTVSALWSTADRMCASLSGPTGSAGFGRARVAHLVRQTRVEPLELAGAAPSW